MAFQFLVERIDAWMAGRAGQKVMLIGDRESDRHAEAYAERLHGYRRDGTPYDYGITLKHILDTVHFTHSHLSRMLQLADLHVWLLQFMRGGYHDRTPRKEIFELVRSLENPVRPNKYKNFPSSRG